MQGVTLALKMLQHFQDLVHSLSLYGPTLSRQITYAAVSRKVVSQKCESKRENVDSDYA